MLTESESILFLVAVSPLAVLASVMSWRQSRQTHAIVQKTDALVQGFADRMAAENGRARAEGTLAGEANQRSRAETRRTRTPTRVVGVADPDAEPIRTVNAKEEER
jgi:hypothetical protein